MKPSTPTFTLDGLLFGAEDLIDIQDPLTGEISADGKIKLAAKNITLNAGSLSVEEASAILTNEKIEILGKWLGLSLTLRALVEQNSFSLAGELEYETGINIITKMSLPNPLGGEIKLGEIHISSDIDVEIEIGMTLDSLSARLLVAFECMGKHAFEFTTSELPSTVDGLADLIRQEIEEWVLSNLAPDRFLPREGELFPANPFVSVTGKLAGNISPDGEIYLSATGVSLSALNGTFVVGQGEALLDNNSISLSGKWLSRLAILLDIEVSHNALSLTGETAISLSSFSANLPFSNLPNPFGGLLSHLSDTLSVSAAGTIAITIHNANFSARIDLEIECMGTHRLPPLTLTSPPASLAALTTTLQTTIRNWITQKLSPENLLPKGLFQFPSAIPVKLNGTPGGYVDESGKFYIGVKNAGLSIGSFDFGTTTLTMQNNKAEIVGTYLGVTMTVNLKKEGNGLLLVGVFKPKTISLNKSLGTLSFPIPGLPFPLSIGPLNINIGSLSVKMGFVLSATSFVFSISCTINFFGLSKSLYISLSSPPADTAALLKEIGDEIARKAWGWIKEVMGTNPFTVLIAAANAVSNAGGSIVKISLRGSRITSLDLRKKFEDMMTMDCHISIGGVHLASAAIRKSGSTYLVNGSAGYSANMIQLGGGLSGSFNTGGGGFALSGNNIGLRFNGVSVMTMSASLNQNALKFSVHFAGASRSLRFNTHNRTITMDDFTLGTSIREIAIPVVKTGGAPRGFGPAWGKVKQEVGLPYATVSLSIGGSFTIRVRSDFKVPVFNKSASVDYTHSSPIDINQFFNSLPDFLKDKVAENINGLCNFPRINYDYSYTTPHANWHGNGKVCRSHAHSHANSPSWHLDAPHVNGIKDIR